MARRTRVIGLLGLGLGLFMGLAPFGSNAKKLDWRKSCGRCLECALSGDDSARDCDGVDYLLNSDATGIISPWHDVPTFPGGDGVVNMIVEIPPGETAKMEIRPDIRGNPMVQDVEHDGAPRHLPRPVWFSYGMIPQTWEAPVPASLVGLPEGVESVIGDGDPLDIVEISGEALEMGSLHAVKVLGVLPLIDDGEVDWKVIAVKADHPLADGLDSLEDLERMAPGEVHRYMEYFETYKLATRGQRNTYANNGDAVDRDGAMEVIRELRGQWGSALERKACPATRRRSIAVELEGLHVCDAECCWGLHLAAGGVHDEL